MKTTRILFIALLFGLIVSALSIVLSGAGATPACLALTLSSALIPVAATAIGLRKGSTRPADVVVGRRDLRDDLVLTTG